MRLPRRNLGAYCGERLHVDEVQSALVAEAARKGWSTEWLACDDGDTFPAFHRLPTDASRRKLYLSAGIHGDEPAGPLAVLRLLEADEWPSDAAVWICPLLNFSGFQRNTREDRLGIDLNRDYLHARTSRVRAHKSWLTHAAPRFDFGLHLHEDWEATGFYLYELNPRKCPAHGEQAIRAVGEVCPIDMAPMIDGRPAKAGILRPAIDFRTRDDWPEAFYLVQERTELCYTLESPSELPLPIRVQALSMAVNTLMKATGE